MEMEAMRGYKQKELEMIYGIHIADDAFESAAEIFEACGKESNDLWEYTSLHLVERACQSLRESLDLDSEESSLDWDEYYLDRTFVEIMELRKEKSTFCQSLLPHVEREDAELRSKWECFRTKWDLQLAQMKENSTRREILLRDMRSKIVSLTKRITSLGNIEKKLGLEKLLQGICNANTQLQHTIPRAFQERRVVGSSVVAQVASSMAGQPLKYLQSNYMSSTEYENLQSRLSEQTVELDVVINKITHSLTREISSRDHFRSFLLLGACGCGRTTLGKALAKEIFNDKDRFIKVDMSEYMSMSRLIAILDRDKKHGSVVMFVNVEKAPWSNEVLFSILRDGEVIDDQNGVCVNFSLDILLVSSNTGLEHFLSCSCLKDKLQERPFLEILKDRSLLHSHCRLFTFCDKVVDHFQFGLLELFDDLIVFPWIPPKGHLSIARLQIKDVAISMSNMVGKKVILYPSYSALHKITGSTHIFERGAHVYDTWTAEFMDSMLNGDTLKNEASSDIIIYIDTFLGWRQKYSFRVETSKHLAKNLDFKRFKQSLWNLRSRYRLAKKQIDKIYKLQTNLFELVTSNEAKIDEDSVFEKSKKALSLIDDIVFNDILESQLMHVDDFVEKLNCWPRYKNMTSTQPRVLPSLLRDGDEATQVIVEAVYNNSSHIPTSFLCVGLTPLSIKKLMERLAQNLVKDDGKRALVEIDLSQCTKLQQFLRYMNKISPHSVIVLYEVEMANISIFSNLLSILDDGVLKDYSSNITQFQNCVFVIVSLRANKEMIGALTGHRGYVGWPDYILGRVYVYDESDEKIFGGLRCELLNRLDHLLFFDPFSLYQLNAFTMCPLKSLISDSKTCLWIAFEYLFQRSRGYYTIEDFFHAITKAPREGRIRYFNFGKTRSESVERRNPLRPRL